MQVPLRALLMTVLLLACLNEAQAQSAAPESSPAGAQNPQVGAPLHKQTEQAPEPTSEERLEALRQEVKNLRKEQKTAQQTAPTDQQKKQLELLQKQIDTLEKMIELLAERVKKQPPPGVALERLEARSLQAAQRDQELAQGIDNLLEQRDADQRNGPRWPATLKELFLPSQTNESPLSIHGTFTTTFTKFQNQNGNFSIDEFSPYFLLHLNERFQLEAELIFSPSGVELSQAQADFFVNDWLTVTGGRFLVPVGFFNERIHPSWINKLPDFPLMFRQVSLADFKTNGIQFRGAHYLGCWPVKMEYALFLSNGLELNNQMPALSDVANLQSFSTFNQLADTLAYGGRLGFWLPEQGLMFGISGMVNGAYTPGPAGDNFDLWQADAGYHKGNWDIRFEYAQLRQEATSFIGNNINRTGLYAQVAYRPYDACEYLRNLEVVFRYGYTNFSGIDPTGLDLTTFATLVDVPVKRNQYTVGINYYFYPSLVLKLAYEFNDERDFPLHDNVFMAQLGWGF